MDANDKDSMIRLYNIVNTKGYRVKKEDKESIIDLMKKYPGLPRNLE